MKGGFAMLYDTFARLETLGVCRRGYFIEGMGGAQFALPGAVERLRAAPLRDGEKPAALVLAASDPAQPFGASLPWPKREGGERRPARVAGAYVVLVDQQPVLYVERGGRGLLTLADGAAAARRRRGRATTRSRRRSRRSPTRCAPGAWASSRSSGSTASPRSNRRTFERSASSASRPGRGG